MSDSSNNKDLKPEEKARIKIDQWLEEVGWKVVSRDEYSNAINAQAVKENLMEGNLEADYMLFLNGKAIAVLEAKKAESKLGDDVKAQAENYTRILPPSNQYWFNPIPFVFISNGETMLFKDMRNPDNPYFNLGKMYSPKEIVERAGIEDEYAKLPPVGPKGLRECQFEAISNLELSFKYGEQKALIVLATGAGKTFTACTAAYRLLNYTSAKRVLFLVDRNNLGKQAEGEFGTYKLTETGNAFSDEYIVHRLKSVEKIGNASVVISTIQRLFAALTGQTIEDNDDDEESSEEGSSTGKVTLTGNILLPPDFFDVIIIDECHRSIYGDWQQVLTYFNKAKIIGLTATPTPEAEAFFNKNRVVNYTLEKSIADGVNVPPRFLELRQKFQKMELLLMTEKKLKNYQNILGIKKLKSNKKIGNIQKQNWTEVSLYQLK